MKLVIGVTRKRVRTNDSFHGNDAITIQKPEDTLELVIPDDGYEFLDRIWLQTEDGETLLDLPLTFGLRSPKYAEPNDDTRIPRTSLL